MHEQGGETEGAGDRITGVEVGDSNTVITVSTVTGRSEGTEEWEKTQWRSKVAKTVKYVMNFRVFFPYEADYKFNSNICNLVTNRCGMQNATVDKRKMWWEGT